MIQEKNTLNRAAGVILLAGIGLAALLCAVSPALAAVGPPLLSNSTYGVVSETYTNTVAGTTIIGTVAQPVLCYTIAPAIIPIVTGTIVVPCPPSTGVDQGTARAILDGQPCTNLGPGALNLNAVDVGSGPGIFPPGCYTNGGAMNITTGTTVTLTGAGVYVFRPGGALTTEANAIVSVAGGACETDVFWAPVGGTTLGANTIFRGNIFRGNAAGLSITFGNAASLTGRALAFGSTVTTNGANSITVPVCGPFVPPPPVLLGKAFLPSTIGEGGTSTLTITFINNNAGPATLTANMVDNLPAGVTTVGLPATTCGGTAPTVTATSVTLPIGATIPGGAPGTCTVTVNVTAATAGSYTNTLAAGALQTDLGANPVAASAILLVNTFAATVPTLNEWGMIIFMLIAGLGSVYYMRRYRRV
ncbi:MAG: IPTL-CTERM sorting domain-containing protein [Thermodesulfovibrionales bacterium]